MHDYCTSRPQIVAGYVAGWGGKHEWDKDAATLTALDTMPGTTANNVAMSAVNTAKGGVCLTEGITVGQLNEVFCKYLENHPENRHQSATELVQKSFSEAWPCK
ncbi:Rap1a/Tai family immunity protein [Rhizobium sp. TH2]|uniref:Rap1a/Tai family immunity protein n=1 Tax=Rhizobium sp. TH2 TaxID=2775403 RepID=UPI0035BE735F